MDIKDVWLSWLTNVFDKKYTSLPNKSPSGSDIKNKNNQNEKITKESQIAIALIYFFKGFY